MPLHRAALCAAAVCACAAGAHAAEIPDTEHDHAIDQIVVTASPLEQMGDELAIPVSVVTREHLLEHLGSTLGETLTYEPGITSSGFAPGASRPVVRGQDSFRVSTLRNGIGTHDVSVLSADHGLPVNPLALRRVEVVRGPASLRYGGGAIAGVINAIDDRVPRVLPPGPVGGEVLFAYGYNGNQRDAAALLDGAFGTFAWHLDAASRDSTDFDLPDSAGEEPFTDTDGYTLSGGVSWIGDGGRVGIARTRFANEYGIPAPEAGPLSIDLESDRWLLEADWEQPLPGLTALRLRAARTDYAHAELENGSEVGSTFDNRERELRLEALHGELGSWTGALGVHVRDRDLDATGEGGELLAPSDLTSRAIYLFEERPLSDRLTIELGARIEDTELDGTPFTGPGRSESFSPLSGSAGLVLQLADQISLGLTLAVTQRAPDTLELFARGPHEATETFEIGDPDLGEETARSADLRLSASGDDWKLEWTAFYTSFEDFIFGTFTGDSRDEDGTEYPNDPVTGELLELEFRHDDARFLGTELQGHLDLGVWRGGTVGLDARFDLVRARLRGGEDVPRIPPVRWGAGLYWSHPRWALRVGFLRAEKQDDLGTGETPTSAWTQLDASLAVPLGDVWSLGVTGTNLLDEKARNHVSFKKDDVLLPGRGVRVALRGLF